jgi:hypothetical protein
MEEEKTENTEVTNEQEQQPQEGESNKIFDALYSAVEGEPEEEEERQEYKPPASIQSALHEIEQESEEPVATEETEETEQAEAPKEKPKPKQKVKRKVVDPKFDVAPRPTVRPRPTQVKSEDPFVSDLLPEEKERYELAKWASQNMPDQKGLDKQYLDYFKKQKAFIDKNQDYGDDFAQSSEWKQFQEKNRPKVNVREIERKKIVNEATEEAKKAYQPKIAEQERELFKIRQEPVVQQKIQEAKKVFNQVVPEEVKNNFDEYAKNNPMESGIIGGTVKNAFTMVEEFLNVMNGLKQVDNNDPVQKAVNDFIKAEQDRFINSGKTRRNGKTFVRMERFRNVPAAQKEKYYTFTEEDVVNLLSLRAKEQIDKKIKQSHDNLRKAGYVRQGEQPVQEPVQPIPSAPPSVPTPAPRAGTSVPAGQSQSDQKNTILSLLDL